MSSEDGTDYTNLNFLSSLKNAPKKSFFKPQSLNTDLEEINQILNSPKGVHPQKHPLPPTLNTQMTKTFVLEILRKYETPEEAEKKWQCFLKSTSSPPEFQLFVKSLQQISPALQRVEVKVNPETNERKEEVPPLTNQRVLKRTYSFKKVEAGGQLEQRRTTPSNIRRLLKKQLQEMKELLLAGERFIRDA